MRHIWIGDKKLLVRPTAYDVLDHLRDQKVDRIVWIDSVCINQNDNDERSQQIQQMAKIFNLAEQVHIWLGNPWNSTPLIMISLMLLEERIRLAGDRQNDQEWDSHWDVVQLKFPAPREIQKESLRLILGLPWFRRVWILQEVANTKRTRVHCGMKSVSGIIFAAAPGLVNMDVESHPQAVLDLMRGARRRPSWWSADRDLYSLLNRFNTTEATEDRDRIYALLGMCVSERQFEVDYSAKIKSVIQYTITYLDPHPSLPRDRIPSLANHFLTVKTFCSRISELGNLILEELIKLQSVDAISAFLQDHEGDVELTWTSLRLASHYVVNDNVMLAFLLQHPCQKIKLTSSGVNNVLIRQPADAELLEILLQVLRCKTHVNKDMLVDFARCASPRLMHVLLFQPGAASQVTDEVFRTAADNTEGDVDMFSSLLSHEKTKDQAISSLTVVSVAWKHVRDRSYFPYRKLYDLKKKILTNEYSQAIILLKDILRAGIYDVISKFREKPAWPRDSFLTGFDADSFNDSDWAETEFHGIAVWLKGLWQRGRENDGYINWDNPPPLIRQLLLREEYRITGTHS